MNKLFGSGAQITYGPDLPIAAQTFDGALHYRTGTGEGLYIYSIVQDVNSFQAGDQISKRWTPITQTNAQNTILGGVLNGSLQIVSQDFYNGLTFSNDTYSSSGFIGPRAGNNTGMWLGSNAGPMNITAGSLNGSTPGAVLRFAKDGPLQYLPNSSTESTGGNVYHSGNDGAGSGLDADLLDGQEGAYYLNAGNLNAGSINVARLPFMPLQQGGGTGMSNNKVYIGWSSTGTLFAQVDSTSFGSNWPISISGTAAAAVTANYANTAGSANTANTATNANYATSAGNANTATSATSANYATSAGSATNATNATNANYANSAGSANTANSATVASSATTAQTASAVNALNNLWGTQQNWSAIHNFTTDNLAVITGGVGFNLRAIRGVGGGAGGMTFGKQDAAINMGLDNDNVFRIGGFSFGQLMQLYSDGSVVFTNNVTAYSDIRMKKDIVTIDNALFKVAQLNGVNFTRKTDESRGTGLIAQEVQAVLPEAVKENADGLSVAYGNMAGLFVEAIKELKAEVDGLKKQLAALQK